MDGFAFLAGVQQGTMGVSLAMAALWLPVVFLRRRPGRALTRAAQARRRDMLLGLAVAAVILGIIVPSAIFLWVWAAR